ncbi:hypothetical protein LSAT2_002670 [Lamellibrachia satsuma]|nr:hypothetical protein LSAT2_002670 [Lamellibrachia satsuma]
MQQCRFCCFVSVKPQGVTITGLTQSVIENTQVEVKCKVSRVKPRADIYWRKGLRGTLERGTTMSVPISDGTFQLEDTYKVSISRSDHNTKLFCLVTRPGVSTEVWGNSHIIAWRSAKDPPSTRVTQKTSGNPTEGGSVTLTCDITDGRPRDDIKRVTWKKGGQEVTSSGRNNISGRDLTISSLDHSDDDGSYTCAAENAAGMGESSEALQLDIQYKPTMSVETPSPVVEGRPVTITCQSQGARPAVTSVTWKKGQDVVTVTTDKYTGGTVQNPSLTITRATRTDAGQYTCQLNNVIGQHSKTVTLQVWYGRPRDDIKRVTWKKGGQEVTSSGRNNLSGRDLTISSLDHSKDDGSYTCAAENAAGMGGSGGAFQLNVLYLPSSQVTQKTYGNPTGGGSVTLTCDISDGRPRDDIKRVTWKKGGQEVTSSGRNNISGRDLTISSLDHSKDDGSYTCAAENAAGMGGSGDAFQLNVLWQVLAEHPEPEVNSPETMFSIWQDTHSRSSLPRNNTFGAMGM